MLYHLTGPFFFHPSSKESFLPFNSVFVLLILLALLFATTNTTQYPQHHASLQHAMRECIRDKVALLCNTGTTKRIEECCTYTSCPEQGLAARAGGLLRGRRGAEEGRAGEPRFCRVDGSERRWHVITSWCWFAARG